MEASAGQLKLLNAVLGWILTPDAPRVVAWWTFRAVGVPRDEAITLPKVAIGGGTAISSTSRENLTVGADVTAMLQRDGGTFGRAERAWAMKRVRAMMGRSRVDEAGNSPNPRVEKGNEMSGKSPCPTRCAGSNSTDSRS